MGVSWIKDALCVWRGWEVEQDWPLPIWNSETRLVSGMCLCCVRESGTDNMIPLDFSWSICIKFIGMQLTVIRARYLISAVHSGKMSEKCCMSWEMLKLNVSKLIDIIGKMSEKCYNISTKDYKMSDKCFEISREMLYNQPLTNQLILHLPPDRPRSLSLVSCSAAAAERVS